MRDRGVKDEGERKEKEGEVWSVQGERVWRVCGEGEVEDLVRK